MILYHGSNHIIDKPLYGAGKKHNDYGIGFYCTENIELAKNGLYQTIWTDMLIYTTWILMD